MLLTRPGLLSYEYVKGRRKPYVHPFQVFVIANLLYFLVFPILHWSGLKTSLFGYGHWMWYSGWATRLATHQAAAKGISVAELSRRFDHVIDIQSRSMVLLMVPLCALALLVLEWRPKRYFGEHLVFSLHYIASFLLLFMITLSGGFTWTLRALRRWGVGTGDRDWDPLLSGAGAVIMGFYLFVALRRFYNNSTASAFLKTIAMLGATYVTLDTYRIVLFLTSLYSV